MQSFIIITHKLGSLELFCLLDFCPVEITWYNFTRKESDQNNKVKYEMKKKVGLSL